MHAFNTRARVADASSASRPRKAGCAYLESLPRAMAPRAGVGAGVGAGGVGLAAVRGRLLPAAAAQCFTLIHQR